MVIHNSYQKVMPTVNLLKVLDTLKSLHLFYFRITIIN